MLLICEVYVDATKGCRYGDSGEPRETWTPHLGRLFRSLRAEYGKASNLYVDIKSGEVRHIGWVFSKRMGYEDMPEKHYTREVWVTLYESCDADAPQACVSKYHGAVTRHPFTELDIADYRKRWRA